ncbi:biotin transporter BioY [Corynebacterium breve]|uniref:Biotin transporter n=1 Tax=Corynebacterium breve TaxID=3049799 RepID=A0ABY8VEZ7_9CORY|nr:biotin transporter BioY [Corynebacterium breve]WIM66799.1 biotin transporter BioY [Corynebacterium breve]
MTNTKNSTAIDLAYIAVFATLIIVLAFVSIPVGTAGVPIVLQNAAVILAGLVLGARRGFLSALLFLALGLIGIPVLAGGRTTLAALAGPTVGYLVGYLVSAFVAGAIAYAGVKSKPATRVVWFILAGIAGLACQYGCGTLGLMFRADMDLAAAAVAQVPFLLPDSAKVAVMVIIALAVHQAFPDLARRK